MLNKSTSTGLHFIATHLAGAQGIFMGLASQTELGAVSYQKRVLQNQIIGETRAVAANPRPRTSIEMGVDVDGMDHAWMKEERGLSETGLSHVRSVQQNRYLETVEKDIFLPVC